MEYMRTLPEKHPFVTIADWAYAIGQKSEVLGADKIHIGGNKEGIEIYVNCIIDAISEAGEKPAKGESRGGIPGDLGPGSERRED